MASSTAGGRAESRNEEATVRASAVICTLNRAAYLARALKSLINQTYSGEDYEIIVVDNGSTDDTREVVEQFDQRAAIKYLYEPVKGLSQARNTGWQAAAGEYIAFLDDDAVASPRWLEKMIQAFETVKPVPASVGGRVVPIWESQRPDWLTDPMLTFYAIVDWGNRARFFEPSDPEHHIGCNVAYRRDVLEQCGGFNVNLGRKGKNLLSNDEDLIRKYMDSHGLPVYYDPEILVEHVVPKERLTKRFMLRRHFWQGVSDVVLQYEESPSSPGSVGPLMSGLKGLTQVGLRLARLLPRFLLRKREAAEAGAPGTKTPPGRLIGGLSYLWLSLGQSYGYIQIARGCHAKGAGKGVARPT